MIIGKEIDCDSARKLRASTPPRRGHAPNGAIRTKIERFRVSGLPNIVENLKY